MTVKELMSEVDPQRVEDAFFMLNYAFSEHNYENTFFEKYNAIPKMRKIIEENIRLFAECSTNEDVESHTIFIMYLQDNDDYEESWKKSFSSFAINDKEVLPVLNKDFHLFDAKGEAEVNHYGYDNMPMNHLANYKIADSSIEQFGKEICAAHILSEVFFWGILPKKREEKVADLNARLEESMNNKNEENYVSFDEFMEEWRLEILQEMSEDEKAYYLAKERFEEETKEIRSHFLRETNEKIHQEYIAAIKKEYQERI